MDRKPLHTPGTAYNDNSGLEVALDICGDGKHAVQGPTVSATGGYPQPTTPGSTIYPEVHIESDKFIDNAATHGYYAGSRQGGNQGGEDQRLPSFSTHPQEQGAPGDGDPGRGSSRKRTAIFIGLAILGVVVAGVVGGVAGWKISEARNRGTAQTSGGSGGSSGASTAGASKMLKPGSPLAATGFRYDGDYQIRIFYLAPEGGTPYTSVFDTAYGSWTIPVKASGPLPHASTSLAAGVSMRNHYDKIVPRYMLHYTGTDAKMASVGFQMPVRRSGEPNREVTDSLEDSRVGTGGSIGAYWPYLVFQDNGAAGSGLIEHNITILGVRDSRQRLSRILDSGGGPQVALGSPILTLPLSPDVPRDELRVVYRSTEGGRLAVFDRNAKREQVRRHTLPPGFSLAEGAPLAGFATRKGSNTLTTHLVWRAENGKIVTGFQEGGAASAWQQQNPVEEPAFADAADDSRLACVTAGSTSYERLNEPIRESDDMNRCFFQTKNGSLAEAWFDGEGWRNVGVVRMPLP